MLDFINDFLAKALEGQGQQRVRDHLGRLALSAVVCLGRRQVTGMLYAAGESFQDWSCAYRLFSRQRVEPEQLFSNALGGVMSQLQQAEPLVVAIDDTLLPKSSAKTAGVGWRRDPLASRQSRRRILGARRRSRIV